MEIFGITFTKGELWLLGIAGAWALTLVYNMLSKNRATESQLVAASDKLYEAFESDLRMLKNCTYGNPARFLAEDFQNQQTAVEEYAQLLGYWQRRRLMNAWRDYAVRGGAPYHFINTYSNATCGDSEGRNRRKLAVTNIERILSFRKTA